MDEDYSLGSKKKLHYYRCEYGCKNRKFHSEVTYRAHCLLHENQNHERTCSYCNASYFSSFDYELHIQDKYHKLRVQQKRSSEDKQVLVCIYKLEGQNEYLF